MHAIWWVSGAGRGGTGGGGGGYVSAEGFVYGYFCGLVALEGQLEDESRGGLIDLHILRGEL